MQFQRRAHGAQLVIFVRDRHAEERDDLLADRLIDQSAVAAHDSTAVSRSARDQAMRLDRRHLIDERRIVRDDGDQHRGAAALRRRHQRWIVETPAALTADPVVGTVDRADSSAARSDIEA